MRSGSPPSLKPRISITSLVCSVTPSMARTARVAALANPELRFWSQTKLSIWVLFTNSDSAAARPVREVVAFSETSIFLAGGDRMKQTWRIRRSGRRR